jgi:hypothetical protein
LFDATSLASSLDQLVVCSVAVTPYFKRLPLNGKKSVVMQLETVQQLLQSLQLCSVTVVTKTETKMIAIYNIIMKTKMMS